MNPEPSDSELLRLIREQMSVAAAAEKIVRAEQPVKYHDDIVAGVWASAAGRIAELLGVPGPGLYTEIRQ